MQVKDIKEEKSIRDLVMAHLHLSYLSTSDIRRVDFLGLTVDRLQATYPSAMLILIDTVFKITTAHATNPRCRETGRCFLML